jgi:hypothetical protein
MGEGGDGTEGKRKKSEADMKGKRQSIIKANMQ